MAKLKQHLQEYVNACWSCIYMDDRTHSTHHERPKAKEHAVGNYRPIACLPLCGIGHLSCQELLLRIIAKNYC